MRRVHTIKIEADYAYAVHFGDKNFEIRYNDRGYQKGDIVEFLPLCEDSHTIIDPDHPLYKKRYEITYVLGSFHGLTDGWVAFGIKPFEEGGDTE